jgi:hypothetical protein
LQQKLIRPTKPKAKNLIRGVQGSTESQRKPVVSVRKNKQGKSRDVRRSHLTIAGVFELKMYHLQFSSVFVTLGSKSIFPSLRIGAHTLARRGQNFK